MNLRFVEKVEKHGSCFSHRRRRTRSNRISINAVTRLHLFSSRMIARSMVAKNPGRSLLDLFKEWLSDMQPRLALQNTSLRTRFVTPSQQIYFSPVQTFDPCNPCSVTQASKPHRFIHTLPTTR